MEIKYIVFNTELDISETLRHSYIFNLLLLILSIFPNPRLGSNFCKIKTSGCKQIRFGKAIDFE